MAKYLIESDVEEAALEILEEMGYAVSMVQISLLTARGRRGRTMMTLYLPPYKFQKPKNITAFWITARIAAK